MAVMTAAVALIMLPLLCGCATGAPTDAATTNFAKPTPTPSATPSTTAAPGPEVESNEQIAWQACAAIAQKEYVSQNPGSSIEPFSAQRDTFQDFGDGTPRMMVGVQPPRSSDTVGGLVVICTMSDKGNAPTVVSWTIKDV